MKLVSQVFFVSRENVEKRAVQDGIDGRATALIDREHALEEVHVVGREGAGARGDLVGGGLHDGRKAEHERRRWWIVCRDSSHFSVASSSCGRTPKVIPKNITPKDQHRP